MRNLAGVFFIKHSELPITYRQQADLLQSNGLVKKGMNRKGTGQFIYPIKLKIKVFAYCVMDNHYRPIIENSGRKMSECLKQLNGLYGMPYRKC
jgi:hypothetical protein